MVEETEELVGWVQVARVNGALGFTRSIGDLLIKDWKENQFKKQFTGELVIPDPDVVEETINVSTDQFLILASDGKKKKKRKLLFQANSLLFDLKVCGMFLKVRQLFLSFCLGCSAKNLPKS